MSLGYVTVVEQNMAKAQGTNLPISLKHAIEICNHIRGMPLATAKKTLEEVIALNAPIPFKRFTDGVGHRKGNLAAGRYPVKACSEILRLLSSAESNALYKGMNTKDLFIAAIVPKQAPGEWRHGRQRRRKMKRAHVEVILQERIAGKRATAKSAPTPSQLTAEKPVTTEKPEVKAEKEPISLKTEPQKIEPKETKQDTVNTVKQDPPEQDAIKKKETDKDAPSEEKAKKNTPDVAAAKGTSKQSASSESTSAKTNTGATQ